MTNPRLVRFLVAFLNREFKTRFAVVYFFFRVQSFGWFFGRLVCRFMGLVKMHVVFLREYLIKVSIQMGFRFC